ncbi:hypothetical protein Corgl_1398 [Coriobacterium glomerans PW2]|uniref:Uncharacterized protein n=1 Tax=Coriobacterium glomerans (strain ATCC 49209 / DSM 20642 / JCM 10262 / PW2) TaxID=700015 RepID=F2NAP3_CORGP|nr:hypothetical protein Corgl_1398 [Coriobacterium glomerans PW2]
MLILYTFAETVPVLLHVSRKLHNLSAAPSAIASQSASTPIPNPLRISGSRHRLTRPAQRAGIDGPCGERPACFSESKGPARAPC